MEEEKKDFLQKKLSSTEEENRKFRANLKMGEREEVHSFGLQRRCNAAINAWSHECKTAKEDREKRVEDIVSLKPPHSERNLRG